MAKVIAKGKQYSVIDKEKVGCNEVEITAPEGTEVVVKITHAGICHSDLHAFLHESAYALFPFPQYPGHEILGTVFAVGPDAKGAVEEKAVGVTENAPVMVYPWVGCDNCDRCAAGNQNFCNEKMSITRYIGGITLAQNGYAEYVKVPHPKYLISSENIEAEIATILPCCGLTTYNAVKESQSSPHTNKEGVLVIIGAGGLGTFGIQWAKLLSKQTIVAVDMSDEALENAKKFGADFTANPGATADIAKFIKELPGVENKEVQAIIDFVGSTPSFQTALSLIEKGTTLVTVGIHGGEIKYDYSRIPFSGARFTGILVGSLNDMVELSDIARNGKLKSIVTKHLKLHQLSEGLSDLRDGKVRGRSIIDVA